MTVAESREKLQELFQSACVFVKRARLIFRKTQLVNVRKTRLVNVRRLDMKSLTFDPVFAKKLRLMFLIPGSCTMNSSLKVH